MEALEAAEAQAGDGFEQGSLAQRVLAWWSAAPRDEKVRNAILGGVVGAIVIAVVIATSVSGSDGSTTPTTASSSSSSSSPTTTLPMFDPNASETQVLHSIYQWCGSTPASSVNADGATQFQCINTPGSTGSISFPVTFLVYATPQDFQIALNAGTVSCLASISVTGPSWGASMSEASQAAALIQLGATSGTCNSSSGSTGDGQSNDGGIPNCPDGSLAQPNGNGPGWLCDDGSTIP